MAGFIPIATAAIAMKAGALQDPPVKPIVEKRFYSIEFASLPSSNGNYRNGKTFGPGAKILGASGAAPPLLENADSLAAKYNTPSLIQHFILDNIIYDDAQFPDVKDGLNEYATFDRILKAKRGDCSEGFVVAACLLHKLGYEISGLVITPDNGEPGHVVAVYKDQKTGLYGTVGINKQDYSLPSYSPEFRKLGITH